MKRNTIALIAACLVATTLSAAAMADEEAANRPVVRSSESGTVYAKSVPDAGYGQEGKTRVFSVAKDRDTLTCQYDWYANEIYIGGAGDGTLVRFGPWHRGHEPQESHLAVGIYRNGKSIREYTTLEMQRLGSGFSKSKSHYTIFKRHLGFRWLKGDVCVYEFEGVSGKVFRLDLDTGVITERTTEQVAPASVKKPRRTNDKSARSIVDTAPLQDRDQLLKQWQQLPIRIRSKIRAAGPLALSAIGNIQLIGVYNQWGSEGDTEKPKQLFHLRQTALDSLLWSVLINAEDETYRILFHHNEIGDTDAPWLKIQDE